MKSIKTPVILAVIAVISVILFIPFLGYVDLFDWDEANFAEAAREMIVTGDYLTVQIDFEPFWEKPPLFIWLQAVSMNVFGVNEFAARFPNAVCGVVTLWALFLAGRKIAGNRPGILWAFVYAASILPQFYFRSGIIDPWFNLFIFLGVYFIAGASNTEFPKWWHFTLAGTFIGLAVMTKGPAGLLIFGLVYLVWLIIGRFRKLPSFRNLLLLLSSVICVGSIWFIAEIISGRFEIIMGFFDYHIRLLSTQDAGHGGPFYYHFVVVLLGCFPASFFIFPNLRSHLKDKGAAGSFGLWMILLLAVVLVLFSLVKTKIIHYSSLAYFPVTFLAAVSIDSLFVTNAVLKRGFKIPVFIMTLLIAFALLAFPFVLANREALPVQDFIKNEFAAACLRAEVQWSIADYIPGALLLSGGVIFILFAARKMKTAVISLFISALLAVNLSALLLAPKAGQFVQRAAIDFYRAHSNGASYVKPLGFKSYAYLFYTNKQKPENPNHNNKDWLLHGAVDKPVYFVVRVTEARQHEEWFPDFIRLYEKNGFVFYLREMPEKQPQ